MTVARDDFVVAAQVLVDGFRFCRRFDDDDLHVSVRLGARGRENFLTQGDEVARVTLDPSDEFQFEQKRGDGGG